MGRVRYPRPMTVHPIWYTDVTLSIKQRIIDTYNGCRYNKGYDKVF